MEQTATTQVNSAMAKAHSKSNLELDALHVINKINYYSRGSCNLLFLKTSFLGFMELVCYLATGWLIYFSFNTRNAILAASEKIQDNRVIWQEMDTNEIFALFLTLKILLFLSAAFLMLIAILLRKIRMKNTALRKVKERVSDFLERHRNA